MLDSSELKLLLANKDVSRKIKVLAILITNEDKPKAVSEIVDIGEKHGLRAIKKWNVSQILGSLSDMVVRLPNGWEITSLGKKIIAEQEPLSYSPIKQQHIDLRKYAEVITSDSTRLFISECIVALEMNLLRSAVTLSWVGAISLLYEEIITNHLAEFNVELQRRKPKHKVVKSTDDLAGIKEYDFLQIICSISVMGKNVKHELEQCLKLRNACSHPNSLKIGERRVSAHLEILILNVYQKFLI